MQLQIYMYIIFEKLWHAVRWVLSSDFNLVILWQDLSLVGRWFQSLRAATEKDLHVSPQVRFEVGSFRSDMLLERKLHDLYAVQKYKLCEQLT